jgi:hypothetical protein
MKILRGADDARIVPQRRSTTHPRRDTGVSFGYYGPHHRAHWRIHGP